MNSGQPAATLTATTLVSDVAVVTVLGELTVLEWKQVTREILQPHRITLSRGTVLDLSAIHCMDSTDVEMLEQLLQVAQLVGHPVIVTEFRPEVVATVVQLGLNLSKDQVRGTVEEAIKQLGRGSEP